MIQIKNRTFLLGGFHDHWERADSENPALLLAALNFYHYDFIVLMDSAPVVDLVQRTAVAFGNTLRVYPGREEATGWAHIVTINPRAPALEGDSVNFREELRKLRETSDLVILAHPNYIAWEPLVETGEMDRLFDEGFFDGVQFGPPGSDHFTERVHFLRKWYLDRRASGKITALVGGWDLHNTLHLPELPPVLYSSSRPPDGHFEAPTDNRTIVEASENSLSAICAAVRMGRTAVEDMRTGEIFGPPDFVSFLESNGYHEIIGELNKKRDAVALSVNGYLKGNREARFSLTKTGKLYLPESLEKAKIVEVKKHENITLNTVPLPLARNRFFLPVGWSSEGYSRIWAVSVEHQIRYDVLPRFVDRKPYVEFLPLASFDGTVKMDIPDVLSEEKQSVNEEKLFGLEPGKVSADIPLRYSCEASSGGIGICKEGWLTFCPVRKFGGSWNDIETIGVDKPLNVPENAYGAKRPWRGPEVFSAQIRFAWTGTEFMFQANVRDEIHFQPNTGHYVYNADCLQLAVDPMLRRQDLPGNIYVFNLSLTPKGPELYRWLGPRLEATADFVPPPDDVSMGDRYLKIEQRDNGLLYDLRLPWSELAPVKPDCNTRLGIYLIFMNNNGHGLLDTLHWPVPVPGMWTVPKKWGVLSLMS
jgi:hypothetical protein